MTDKYIIKNRYSTQ